MVSPYCFLCDMYLVEFHCACHPNGDPAVKFRVWIKEHASNTNVYFRRADEAESSGRTLFYIAFPTYTMQVYMTAAAGTTSSEPPSNDLDLNGVRRVPAFLPTGRACVYMYSHIFHWAKVWLKFGIYYFLRGQLQSSMHRRGRLRRRPGQRGTF